MLLSLPFKVLCVTVDCLRAKSPVRGGFTMNEMTKEQYVLAHTLPIIILFAVFVLPLLFTSSTDVHAEAVPAEVVYEMDYDHEARMAWNTFQRNICRGETTYNEFGHGRTEWLCPPVMSDEFKPFMAELREDFAHVAMERHYRGEINADLADAMIDLVR